MHCRRAEERLQSLLDARRPFAVDRELSQHLAGCPACQAQAAAYERLVLCFAGPRRRLAVVRPAGSASRSRWSRYPLPAALAAAVAGVALWLPQRLEQAGPQLALRGLPGAAQGASNAPAEAGPNRDLLTDAAMTHLAALGPLSISVLNLEPPTAPEWVEPVSGGFRPVTRSVEAAFGAMRDTMLWEPTTRS